MTQHAPVAHDSFHSTPPLTASTGTERAVAALSILLNDSTEGHMVLPMPKISFHAQAEHDNPAETVLTYEGAFSASQFDRLNYLANAANMSVLVLPAAVSVAPEAMRIELRGGNTEKLEALAASEARRRETAQEAEPIISRKTGLSWCWDGICLSTRCPEEASRSHMVLGSLRKLGVIRNPYDLAVFESHTDKGTTQWISLHDFDLAQLQRVSLDSGLASQGRGR